VNYLDKNGYFDSKFDSPNSVYGIGFDGMSEEDKEIYEESLDRFVGDFQTSILLAPLGFGFSGAIGKAAPLLSKFTGKAKDILGKASKYLGKSADKADEVVGGAGQSLGDGRIAVKEWLQKAGNMERGQLIKDIESAGFKKVFDGKGMMHFERGGMKIRLDPPHLPKTPYNHMHLNYQKSKRSYDVFLNPVDYKSPAAHIPIK